MKLWRVGEHYGIHVYDEDDRPIATFHRRSDAEKAVADHNTRKDTQPDVWLTRLLLTYRQANKTWHDDIIPLGSAYRVWREIPRLIEMAKQPKTPTSDEEDVPD